MAAWIMGGQLVDFIIGLTLIEAVCLMIYQRITQRGLALKDYGLNLASGVFLLLALRAALAHFSWIWIAGCLTAAGLTHSADIVLRLRQRGKN